MKRISIFLFLSALLFGFISCTKEASSTVDYYITFKVDDVEKKFTEHAVGFIQKIDIADTSFYACAIGAALSVKDSIKNVFGMGLLEPSEFVTNRIYTNDRALNSISYADEDGNLYFADQYSTNGPTIQIQFSKIDKDTFAGTFSGTLIAEDDPNKTITIKVGTFRVKRIQ